MVADAAPRLGKAEAIYQQVRADIETGVYSPGQPLYELMLVEKMGASRTPVREALRRLAADGLVDFAPRRGATVSRISLQSGRELFEYRMILEPAAVRMIAERIDGLDDVRQKVQELADGFAEVGHQQPSAERTAVFYELTERLDALVAAATPNGYLSRAIRELRPHSMRLRSVAHAAPQRMEASLEEHRLWCAALLAGDGDTAADLCREHLHNTMSTIFESLLTDVRGTIDVG